MAVVLILLQTGFSQSAARNKSQKGPRALALLQIGKDNKARLYPIAILDNGKFYDAGAYKAIPVPMALEPETVYEGMATGVPQGLFTITGAGQANGAWIAEGMWVPAGTKPPRKGMKAEMAVIKDDDSGPPKLRRPGSEAADGSKKEEAPAAEKPKATTEPKAPEAPPPASATENEPDDADRPKLKRGIPTAKPAEEAPAKPAAIATKTEKPTNRRSLLAISDASGPDPRPYTFNAKPDEIEKYRKLMLEMAAQDLRKRIDEMTAAARPMNGKPLPNSKATRARGPQPTFSDIDFRVFDLSNANEPVWILSAKGTVAAAKPGMEPSEYFVTIACRTDIYGDLRKLLSQITDAKHLDVLSRLELVDAVDADGDGRGELLFREISGDNNIGYVLYRFTGDTLWKLFDSLGGE